MIDKTLRPRRLTARRATWAAYGESLWFSRCWLFDVVSIILIMFFNLNCLKNLVFNMFY